MPHSCEDCDETFETLSGLRLHDCPDDDTSIERERQTQDEAIDAWIRRTMREEDLAAKQRVADDLIDALERAAKGDHVAVHQALAQYERHLGEAWKNEKNDYWGLHRALFGPAVDGLDTAVMAEGWPFLLEILEAYRPENTLDFESYPEHDAFGARETDEFEDFPHISHVLTTVTGKQLVRTRRSDGVEAIPVDALDYQLRFHRHPGDESPWIDSMSYGWGIGHPDHPVEDTIETLVDGEYDIWASTAIEHAMHADQYAATALIESLFEAEIVSNSPMILQSLGGIERGYYPDSSSHWDWNTLYPEFEESGFDWDPEVRDRLRTVVVDCGLAQRLPDDWTIADIVI